MVHNTPVRRVTIGRRRLTRAPYTAHNTPVRRLLLAAGEADLFVVVRKCALGMRNHF